MDFTRKRLLRSGRVQFLRAYGIAPSSDAFTIESFPFRLNAMYLCLGVAVIDHDSSIPRSVEIGIKDGTALIPVRCQAGSFLANTSANVEFPFIIRPGQRIYAKIDYPHANDHIELIAYGISVSRYIYEARSFSVYRYFGRCRNNCYRAEFDGDQSYSWRFANSSIDNPF